MAEAYLALSGELTALRSLVVVKRILPHLSSGTEAPSVHAPAVPTARRLAGYRK